MSTSFVQIKREDGRTQEVKDIKLSTLEIPNRFGKSLPTECVEFYVVGQTYEYAAFMRKVDFDRLNPDYDF